MDRGFMEHQLGNGTAEKAFHICWELKIEKLCFDKYCTCFGRYRLHTIIRSEKFYGISDNSG